MIKTNKNHLIKIKLPCAVITTILIAILSSCNYSNENQSNPPTYERYSNNEMLDSIDKYASHLENVRLDSIVADSSCFSVFFLDSTSTFLDPITSLQEITYSLQPLRELEYLFYDSVAAYLIMPKRDTGTEVRLFKESSNNVLEHISLFNDPIYRSAIQRIMKIPYENKYGSFISQLNQELNLLLSKDNRIEAQLFGINSFIIVQRSLIECYQNESHYYKDVWSKLIEFKKAEGNLDDMEKFRTVEEIMSQACSKAQNSPTN